MNVKKPVISHAFAFYSIVFVLHKVAYRRYARKCSQMAYIIRVISFDMFNCSIPIILSFVIFPQTHRKKNPVH